MTITIPVWLVIILACLFLVSSIYKFIQLIKGAKAVWPVIKDALNSDKEFDIHVTKTVKDEDSSTR